MGSLETEEGRILDREGPRHTVHIKRPLAVGRFEITVEEFRTFLSEAQYKIGDDCFSVRARGDFVAKSRFSFARPGFHQEPDQPAICVSWNDAQAYVTWLSSATGHRYRLLSEAEWEYVARAGTDTRYWWGKSLDLEDANYVKAHLHKKLGVPQILQTVGGVIQAGETILQIIPVKDLLKAEAKLDPADIDQVHIGQDTVIRFPSFNQRTTPELNGTVSHISADVAQDARGEICFYKVQVSISKEEIKRLDSRKLVPGMPAEVFLQTGDRSALSYLVKPLSNQNEKAFREE